MVSTVSGLGGSRVRYCVLPRTSVCKSMCRLLSCFLLFIVCLPIEAEDRVNFNRDVLPLLSNHCFRCHGPDAESREAGLRLDRAQSALEELDSGDQAVVPGNVEASELMARITSDDEDLRMPPADIGPPLKPDEVEILRQWIEQGARYEKHWSLQPVRRPSIPSGAASAPVDRFIDEALNQQQIQANELADRRTIARRVTLALTGLPPTPEKVAAFEANPDPLAYTRLVERLLSSPEFGERWARVWLDIARYADSAGYAQDPARTIWRYRDWVIDAYNQGKTFDQFTIEQIAGDMLEDPTKEQLLATAFHRNTMTNSEGGTDDEEFRTAAVVDRVNTTMQVWMGLTMGCAQCHDHKYDDITQEEYFRFLAILNNTEDADRGDERPWLEELTPAQENQKANLSRQLADLEKQKDHDQAKRKELEKRVNSIRGVRTPIMRERAEEKARETFIHVRGNFRVRGQKVEAGFPGLLHEQPGPSSVTDRLSLANWLVANENPLTARVVVNRYWELLFGKGLVSTSEDFGVQGELPSHPLLLDYLASEFMRRGWDTKWLIKECVTSQAYRRSSQMTEELAAKDRSNRWLARGPRFRMPAEMIRDQALSVAGLLSKKMFGPSVRPPRPNLGLRAAFGGSTDWAPSKGEDRYRRGLYTSWRRTTPYPSMTTFDAPSREFCSVRRLRTNTPLQALVTLNDPVFVEAAQALARRVLSSQSGRNERLEAAMLLVISRPPTKSESEELNRLYDQTLRQFQDDKVAAQKMAFEPLGKTDDFDVAELATWTVIGNVLLNLDETLAPR